MTAEAAQRDWMAAAMAASALPDGPAKTAAEAKARDLCAAWGDAITAEADARRRMMILPQGLFNPHQGAA